MAQEQTVGSGIADWLELAHGILTLALGAVGFALGGIVSYLPGLAQICRRSGG